MKQWKAYFRDEEIVVQAANADAARDAAEAELRKLRPEDRKVYARFISVHPVEEE